MKKFFAKLMIKAFDDNEAYIRGLISRFARRKSDLKALDVGCGDGGMTQKLFRGTNYKLYGIDIFPPTKFTRMEFTKADFEHGKFNYPDNIFDLVVSNQVIEHLLNKDDMLSEVYRVLKPGGLFILSTENISSFDNILSILFGQEPISQHTSKYFVTSSFLSSHFMQKLDSREGNLYGHKNVCSYYGLKRLVNLAGFKNISIKGYGSILPIFENIFPIYNRVITLTATK